MSTESNFAGRLFPVLIISILALALQFLQTRILSVIYWQHLVYYVVTLSLLGLAVSGTVLSLSRRLSELPEREFVCLCMGGFSASSVLGIAFIVFFSGGSFSLLDPTSILRLVISYVMAMVPFVFFGLLVSGMFFRYPATSGTVYFFNLLGSALGVLVYIVLIRPLGAVNFLFFVIFVPGAVLAMLYGKRAGVGRTLALSLMVVLAVITGTKWMKVEPERNKQYWTMFEKRSVEFTEWNPISRVDVVSDGEEGVKRILIDGDAQTPILPLLKMRERVLGEAKAVWHFDAAKDGPLGGLQGGHGVRVHNGVAVNDGYRGGVVSLKGLDSYVHAGLDPDGRRGTTISLWIKPVANGAAGTGRATPTTRDRSAGCVVRPTGGAENGFSLECLGSAMGLGLFSGEWNHLVVGIDIEGGMVYGYVDGVKSGEMEMPQAAFDSGLALSKGGLKVNGGHFNWLVDEISVWDKVLSESEIRAIGMQGDTYHRDVGYRLARQRGIRDVMVIGAGGGTDVLTAYKHGGKNIDAVEVNPSTFRVVIDRYSDYLGGLFSKDGVRLYLDDGRSFVRRSDKEYDMLMIFAVDSFAALASGAYIMAESYLYTMEAFSDYWDHLSDDGVLQVSRWFYPQMPRETLRAFVTSDETLRNKGISEPWRHIVVVSDVDRDAHSPFADIIVSKRAFDEDELEGLKNWLGPRGLAVTFDPFVAGGGGHPEANAFYGYVSSARGGKKEEFFGGYPFNVVPVMDDNPFFFQYGKWSRLFRGYTQGPVYYESMQGRWPFFVILSLLLQSIVLVTVLVWLPMRRVAPRGGKGSAKVLLYFTFLGLGFMFVEMALIQKFVLTLGHPIYSMATVIPTVLVSAGAGSLFSGRINMESKPALFAVFAVICGLIAVMVVTSPAISRALLTYSVTVRIIAVIILLFPLGFVMGIPFPTGMRRLSAHRRMIPVAWAVNGGMSVIGSILAIVLAMLWGFSHVATIAAGLYLGAFLVFSLRWPTAGDTGREVSGPGGS